MRKANRVLAILVLLSLFLPALPTGALTPLASSSGGGDWKSHR